MSSLRILLRNAFPKVTPRASSSRAQHPSHHHRFFASKKLSKPRSSPRTSNDAVARKPYQPPRNNPPPPQSSPQPSHPPPPPRLSLSNRAWLLLHNLRNTRRTLLIGRNPDGSIPTGPILKLTSPIARAITTTLTSIPSLATLFLLAHFLLRKILYYDSSYGPSMLPTCWVEGDWQLTLRWGYARGGDYEGARRDGGEGKAKGVRVGDVVLALDPLRWGGYHVIKRVIGLPGDLVWLEGPPPPASSSLGGGLDSDSLEEQAVELDSEGRRGRYIRVPRGYCWLEGDNKEHSRDSRWYGPLPLALVQGKVVATVWPPSRWSLMKNNVEIVEDSEMGVAPA